MSQNVSDSARIQQLEAENKRLREAVGTKGEDDDVERQIADLEQAIARHPQVLGKLQRELQALRTSRFVELSPDVQEYQAKIKWQQEHDKELRRKYSGWR
jgi:chromosome segregation ATPase